MALASSRGQIFVTGESETSKLHFVAYNLLSIDLSLPQKSARSSCDVTD